MVVLLGRDSIAKHRPVAGVADSGCPVNDRAYSSDVMEDAIKQAKTDKKPIVLLVNSFDHINEVRLNYHEGLRYPHLERIEGTPDRLSLILAPKK